MARQSTSPINHGAASVVIQLTASMTIGPGKRRCIDTARATMYSGITTEKQLHRDLKFAAG